MILITGGSEGIGFACARAVVERTSTRALVTGRSVTRLAQARLRVPERLRNRLETLVSDQASRPDVDALIRRILEAEPIEGAILTVGVNPLYDDGPCRVHRLDPATVERTIATNCTHTVMVTAALLERFHRQRRGVLIWVGSRAAAAGPPGAALYCATKSFLSGLARAAAHEYESRGIRVHVAHPGLVRTPRTVAVLDRLAARHGEPVAEAPAVGQRIVDLLLEGDPTDVEVDL